MTPERTTTRNPEPANPPTGTHLLPSPGPTGPSGQPARKTSNHYTPKGCLLASSSLINKLQARSSRDGDRITRILTPPDLFQSASARRD